MDTIDIDVKLTLYSMLARLDGDASYVEYRKNIDSMYCISDSSEFDSDSESHFDFGSNDTETSSEEENSSRQKSSVLTENELMDDKEESDPENEMIVEGTTVPLKTKGELSIEDLPPIERLSIIPDGKVEQIGQVSAVLDKILIVKAIRYTPALDIDTVLFLSDGKAIGRIFETFGPVIEPCYVVRFNKYPGIHEMGIKEGLAVCFLPSSPKFTKYVFANDLRNIKGSDASWEDNNEPPPEYLDYSDDEEERMAKAAIDTDRRNNQYAHFLPCPVEKKFVANEIYEEMSCSSVSCDAAVIKSFGTGQYGSKRNLRNKLAGAALTRARRKAARTNLADIPKNAEHASSTSTDVVSLVEEAVKSNPSLLSSIVTSAISAASTSQGGGFLPASLPVMLPPTSEVPSQPRVISTVPSVLPPNLQSHQRSNVQQSNNPPKRRMDPRFVQAKKNN